MIERTDYCDDKIFANHAFDGTKRVVFDRTVAIHAVCIAFNPRLNETLKHRLWLN